MNKIILFLALLLAPHGWSAGPTFISSGAGVAGTGNLSVAYPASPQANDRILIQLLIRRGDLGDTPTTPTGFSQIFNDTGTSAHQYLYCRDATGSESGSITITITGTGLKMARMHLFRATAACASLYESAGLFTNIGLNVNGVTVATTANYRLALAFVLGGDNSAGYTSFVNESGGDWISQNVFQGFGGGFGGTIQLQAAPMPALGTISGGSFSHAGNTENINRSFALLPDPVPPENTQLSVFPIQLLPFTHQQIFTSSGTWSRPLNVDVVYARVQAPGGGGGGGQGAQGVGDDPGGGGAGGSSGQLVQDFVEVSGNVAVTINTAGTGGAGSAAAGVSAPGDPGTNGGTASFGSLVAQGGKGGEGGHLVADAVGGAVVPTPTSGATGTASDSLPVQFFAIRGERGLQGGQGTRAGGGVQTVGASSTLFAGGAVGASAAPPAIGSGAGGGASSEYGVGGQGGAGGDNVHFAGFPGQDGQGAGAGGGGGGSGATFSVGGNDADGADGGDGAGGRVEVYW